MGAQTARLILVSQTRFRNAFADYSGATFLRLTKGSSADPSQMQTVARMLERGNLTPPSLSRACMALRPS